MAIMRRTLLATAVSAAFAAALAAAPADAAKVLKLSIIVPIDSLQGQAAVKFQELTKERGKGAVEVKVYPSNQLGETYQVIDMQRSGSIEMALNGYDAYARYSKALTLAGLSFIMKDRAHAYRVYESELHERIKKEIFESTRTRVLGNAEWNQGPYKILLTKDPITKPADMKGVAMRVPPAEVDLAVWGKAVGAATQPVPWPEAPLALGRGLVRAIELPADFVRSIKFYEHAKYLTLTRHRHQIVYLTISDVTWQGLSQTEQDVVLSSAKDAGKWYTDRVQKQWEDDIAFLKGQGVVIVDFDMTPWHEAVVKVAREMEAAGKWEAGLVDKLLSYAK